MTYGADAFRGLPVLVTGHTGFKGAWLAAWLNRLGARVHGLSLPPAGDGPHPFGAIGVRPLLTSHLEADVRDADRVAAAVRDAGPEVVFHLAARALVRESYEAPQETFAVNVMGTVNVLEAVRRAGRPCVVVVVTTDKCYADVDQPWGYREADRLGGADPYSGSKAACEVAAASYRRSFFPPGRVARHGVKVATARAGNVIGGGDWSRDRLVPDAVRSLTAGRPVPVRNPRAVRPWQHVLEPLDGYLTLAAAMLSADDPRLCDAWNFGPAPGTDVPVGELVDRFCRAWGGGGWEDRSDRAAPHESHALRLCIDKAVRDLGWRPKWPLRTAVERTARWYRRYYDGGGSMLAACLDDVAAYEQTRVSES